MKTKTSKKAILIRSLLLFPLIAILLLGFTETSQVFEKNNKGNFNDVTIIDLEIVNDEEIWLKGKRIKLEKLATELSKLTSKRSKENVLKIYIYAPQALHSDFLELLNKEIEKISPSSINVFSEKYIMRKSQFQDSIEITPSTMRLKTNKMILEPFVPNILININKKGELLIENELLPLEDLKSYISNEYGQLKTEQKKEEFHSTVFIDIDSPSDIVEHVDKVLTEFGNVNILPIEKESLNNSQDGATKEQIKEYNSLAKMYNEMLSKSKSIQIKMKDVNQLKHIYGLMSDKQKAAAEPFPDFPEPPPVPKKPDFPEAPEPPKFNKGENEVPQPPLPPLDKIEDKELHNELQQIREERPQIKYIQVGKNNPVTTIEDLDQKQIQNGVSGAVVINGKNYYFLREGGETKYYNRYGQLVNNQGSLINEKNEPIEFIEIEEVEENSKQKKNNGFLNVNNETLFYTTNEKGTTYYNRYGEKRTLKDSVRVSSQIEDKNRPRESYVQQINDFNNQNALFYFKGEQISYYKALDLVFRKRNLSLATVKPKNNVKPIVILDRNFKKYNYKELIKSHLR